MRNWFISLLLFLRFFRFWLFKSRWSFLNNWLRWLLNRRLGNLRRCFYFLNWRNISRRWNVSCRRSSLKFGLFSWRRLRQSYRLFFFLIFKEWLIHLNSTSSWRVLIAWSLSWRSCFAPNQPRLRSWFLMNDNLIWIKYWWRSRHVLRHWSFRLLR